MSGQPPREVVLSITCASAAEFVELVEKALEAGRVFVPTHGSTPAGASARVAVSCRELAAPLELTGQVASPPAEALARGGVEVSLAGLSRGARDRVERVVWRIRVGDPAVVARTVGVLVVEDNPFSAQLVEDGLRAAGGRLFDGRILFETRTASGVAAAMVALRDTEAEHPIRAVITDFYLSGAERGTDVIRAIREDAALASLAVLAMSAGGDDVRQRCMSAGAQVFLRKPVRMREIARAVVELVGLAVA